MSVDVETDGSLPGRNSMLSIGAAVFGIDKRVHGTFSRNLDLVPGASQEVSVMGFWADNPAAWDASRVAPVPPGEAMSDFVAWVDGLARMGTPVFVAAPAVYDWKWVDHYCLSYAGRNPFGHGTAIDVKTFAWRHLGGDFADLSVGSYPGDWSDGLPHTHVAVEDALEQGAMFVDILRAARCLPRVPYTP